jgi:hypothetical protein
MVSLRRIRRERILPRWQVIVIGVLFTAGIAMAIAGSDGYAHAYLTGKCVGNLMPKNCHYWGLRWTVPP